MGTREREQFRGHTEKRGRHRQQREKTEKAEMLTIFFSRSVQHHGRHFHQDCEEAIEALHPTSV